MASIEHRNTKSGDVWRVRYRRDGKQNVVTFTDQTRARVWRDMANVNLEDALRVLNAPATKDESPVTVEFLLDHIEQLTGVTDGTRREYRSYVAHDLEPHPLGHMRLRDVDGPAVSKWINWLQGERGLSEKSVANRRGLVSAALARAVDLDLMASNPAKGMRIKRTSHEAVEKCFLTRDEFACLYDLIPSHYQPLIFLLASTGMRLGEATALRVGDVDVERRGITISRSWNRTGKAAPQLGPTKTRRSTRTVAVPDAALDLLRSRLEGAPGDLLLVNRRGGPIRQSQLWNGVWRHAVSAFAGDEVESVKDSRGRPVMRVKTRGPGKHPRIHDLRHTYASWAIQSGIPLPVIQRQLGHESITTTIDTYGHLARADFDALAAATGRMLPAIDRTPEPITSTITADIYESGVGHGKQGE